MKQVLITGGSRGIGEALVRRLASDGDRVVFTYRESEERSGELARATGTECVHYDQTSPESVAHLAERIEQGEFEALVNNALAPVPRRLFLKTDPGELVNYVSANLSGVVLCSQALARSLKRRNRGGAIVNVLSSVTMSTPPPRLSPYIVSKYAVLGLTRSMAVELIPHGIRVNAVSPGMTRTEFNAELPEPFINQIEQQLPMKRLATPSDVANVIRFLLSEDASYVNGANIPVTGGDRC